MESPFILKIFSDKELAPEWRICVTFSFGGHEENCVKYVISLEEMEKIKKADKWIEVDNFHIHKDKAEVIIFYTEIKTMEGKWILYSQEKSDEILKQELQHEMAAKHVLKKSQGLKSLDDYIKLKGEVPF